MGNVAQFPRRKTPVSFESAIGQGLEAAKEAGVTKKVLFLKISPGRYLATEDEAIIKQYTEIDHD